MAGEKPQKPTEPPDRFQTDAGVPAKPPKQQAMGEQADAEEEEEE